MIIKRNFHPSAPLIDLHCHSDCSDGTLAPAALVDLALNTGLRALAITDHDTFEGYDLAAGYAVERGLDLLCGVEIGTRFPGASRSTHVLGYFRADPEPGMRAWLLDLQASRHARNLALFDHLRQQGVPIRWEQLHGKARRQLGRPHFAQVLLELGCVHSLQEAFDRYLAETGSAWTKRDEPETGEAIRQIVSAGGIASLAHPVRLSRDMDTLTKIIASLAAAGLGAVECYHTEHTQEETQRLVAIAAEQNLVVTGGSDFHGANKPRTQLGIGEGMLHVPEALLSLLKLRLG